MANLNIAIQIAARDQASGPIGRIRGVLGSLGGTFGRVAKLGAAGTATLVGGLVAAGAGLVSLGSDAEEMRGKFEVVFGENAEGWANRFDILADRLHRNRYELMEFGSAIQDTFVPLGFARDEAADMSLQMTELTVDLASFNNAAEPDVLRDLQSALVGNHETMRKYGVIITEATLKQELARMGMENLEGAALEQAKVQARMNLIMAGTTDAQGDAERTAGSWANQMRAVRATLAETATTMGTELLPIVVPFLQNIATLAEQYAPLVIARFSEFAGQLSQTVGPAMLLVNDAFTRIGGALGLASGEVSTADVLLGALGGTLDAIVIGIEAFALGMQGIAWAVEKTSEAVQIAIDLWSQLGDIWQKLSERTGDFFSGGILSGLGGGQNQPTATPVNPFGQQQSPATNNIFVNPTPLTINLDGQKIADSTSQYQGSALTNYVALGGRGAQ